MSLTQQKALKMFMAKHEGKWCYVPAMKQWYFFDETGWHLDVLLDIEKTMDTFLKTVIVPLVAVESQSDSAVSSWLTVDRMEKLVRGARHNLAIKADIWDADHNLLGTPGGVVDL